MHNIKWKIGSTLKIIKLFVKFGKHDIRNLCLPHSQDKIKEVAQTPYKMAQWGIKLKNDPQLRMN
jgi:hypothetical protein